MDGKGGCCIARYGGGAYDLSKMNRIMLRFRPIAPKPAAGSVSNGRSPDQTEISTRSGRGKKRTSNLSTSINSKKCKGSVRKRKSSSSQEKMDEVVTLPLLPETPERNESPARVSSAEVLSPMKSLGNAPVWLSFDRSMENLDQKIVLDPTVKMPRAVRAVGTCVTVECVTDTWVDGNGMGSTDEERVNNLWKDTCPGFISDGMGIVTWTNGAFEKMVGPGNTRPVVLVMKEKASLAMMMMTWKALTCRLRLQYTRGMEKSSLTLPCDVWTMDSGGLTWRLDVKAALSLGPVDERIS